MVLEVNELFLVDLVKDVLAFGKGKGSHLPLGLMYGPFKWVSFTPLRSGCKTYKEKIKLTGDILIESRLVKPLDAHFPHSTQ